MTIREEALT